MVGRFCECVGLVVVGSVRRGLTSSRHSARKGTASTSSGTQAFIVFLLKRDYCAGSGYRGTTQDFFVLDAA